MVKRLGHSKFRWVVLQLFTSKFLRTWFRWPGAACRAWLTLGMRLLMTTDLIGRALEWVLAHTLQGRLPGNMMMSGGTMLCVTVLLKVVVTAVALLTIEFELRS